MTELVGTLKDKQEEIVKILGFDYETFKNTANFEQGDSDSFSILTPKEAKEVVMKILQLSRFADLEKICRENHKRLYEEGLSLKTEIDFLEKNIDWKEEDESALLKRKDETQKELISLKDTLQLIRGQQETVYEISQLKKTIEKFESLDICPTCKQKVTSNQKETLVGEQKKAVTSLEKIINLEILKKKDIYETSYNTLTAELSSINTVLTVNKQKKEKLEALLANKKNMEQRLIVVKNELTIYKNLTEAFGKNGIPSYIIDNITPEIESIANELLTLLNVNLSIEIGIKKELKSGGTSDTFDIFIRNGRWIRKYSNYSGGERFLIDLVLRVALSVILLRRKGCSNSTLILDEGMGALDGINAPKVLELVKLIQQKYGFEKVLIITHVDALKDMLDNRIEVVKNDSYSEIKI